MCQSIIFDFDGTLVDSEVAIYKCFQNITEKLAPNRLNYAKNILIGPPLEVTALEILGINNAHLLDDFVKSFIKMHDNEIIFHTQLYPSVYETLVELHKKNTPMAIATNKRKNPTLKLLEHFNLKKFFTSLECSDSYIRKRDKSFMVKRIIQQNPEFKYALLIGDTVNDAKAAKENELKFIRASYGYGRNENWKDIPMMKTIESVKEILLLF